MCPEILALTRAPFASNTVSKRLVNLHSTVHRCVRAEGDSHRDALCGRSPGAFKSSMVRVLSSHVAVWLAYKDTLDGVSMCSSSECTEDKKWMNLLYRVPLSRINATLAYRDERRARDHWAPRCHRWSEFMPRGSTAGFQFL